MFGVMLESKQSQFTFSPAGEILWQEKINSPLPGIPVAILEKGEQPLKPVVKIVENNLTSQYDQTILKNHLVLWLNTYLSGVLESLTLLEVPQGVTVKDNPVSQIAARVYDGMGIVPRENLESIIAQLTPETRGDLRTKKIRLGPVLVFMPELNKPAAVRVRAMLWSLFHGYDLPADVPSDGVVSVKIDDDKQNEDYYRAIGYPLYGGRAVRIDMLDRVINCVYDHADGGKFQARHEMAEWLGCSIADLYQVLDSMGHVKIYDPAEVVVEEAGSDVEDGEKPKEKPELATFRLKKGKAFQKKVVGGKKPVQGGKKKAPKKKKDFKKGKAQDRGPRVISAEAKVRAEDSPFAILEQLKK